MLAGVALLAAFAAQWVLRKKDPLMDQQARELVANARKLVHLSRPIGPTLEGDWLASHSEPGQSFRQYLAIDPVTLTEDRGVLYVQPLGDFDDKNKRIVELSAEFLGLYFCCPVKILPDLSLDEVIPAKARRVHTGIRQIKSTFVLDEVLRPRLSDDAVALIAFTTSDLYPQDDWNFVFGQASLRNRVGVWSLYRNGDPELEFTTCLLRTLKTASHETGHMFSIKHCTEFECNMCGSNNRAESDRRPLQLCPECVAKIWYATGCDSTLRFQKLAEFCERNELSESAAYFRAATSALRSLSESEQARIRRNP